MRTKILTFLLLLLALDGAAQADDRRMEVAKNMDILGTAYKHLDMMYVDTLDASRVLGGAISSMLRGLDPYTEYYPADKVSELRTMITGKYAGIGAMIRWNLQLGNSVIDEPYEHMPAAEAGLRRGDVILSIDGESMEGRDNAYVSSHLRGDAGSTFELRVRRPSTGKVLRMRITRRAIQMPAVPYYGMRSGGVGYISLTQFTEDCSKHVRRALVDMKRQGMRSLVLDLRGNGGGSESEAVNIVNLFVSKGVTVVSNRGKLARMNHDYQTTSEPVDTVMPLVVLVDGGSASASEITAGALQDLDRAVIMGTRTYGKGLVQMTVDLPYNTQMKFTTCKYYIPSGRCIQALNYNHSAQRTTVESVADSLTRVFHTRAGREVRDGRGISPDVKVEADSVANIVYYLSANNYVGIPRDSSEVMLQYEIDYQARHATVAGPEEFSLTDDDWAEFKRRVLASGFKYDRESEKYLKDLEKLARFEGYYDDARPEFEALARKLSHNVEHDLDYNREAICHLIADHLMAAYYYQRGSAAYALRHDKQMDEALRLLADESRYHSLLKP